MLRDLPAEERSRMGFAYSEFTRRLLRQGLAAEGLPSDGAEFARRLYGSNLSPEVLRELGRVVQVDTDAGLVLVSAPLTGP